MADQLLQQVQDKLEGQIDFQGQELTELFSTIILSLTGVCLQTDFFHGSRIVLTAARQLLAFVLGFVQQSIWVTLWVGLGGSALTFLIVVPAWPIYNENPEKWLPADSGMVSAGIEVDGKKIN
ncbi:MAG: hypothetical protein Q9219_002231 [cf. Caloplaca sp. 3 TL-2023]